MDTYKHRYLELKSRWEKYSLQERPNKLEEARVMFEWLICTDTL